MSSMLKENELQENELQENVIEEKEIEENDLEENTIVTETLTGVYRICNSKLSNDEYSEILNNFDPAKHKHVDSFINLEVVPGAIYIFNTTNDKKNQDWRADQFAWKNNGTYKPVPNRNPLFLRTFFNGKNKDGKYSNRNI
jgi:hypothetical protein